MSRSILVRQLVSASREELWAACSTARGLSAWQADSARGDAQSGESVTLMWPALHLNVRLEVKEMVPGERLVLMVGPSRLTMEIEPGQVRLIHEGLRSEDEEDGMRSAWRTSLGLLAHGLMHHRGRERRVHWITRTAKVSPPISHLFFTERAALGQWLTRAGEIGLEGTELDLELLTGERLTGDVIANTPDRDVSFTWREEADSYLVLRTFPAQGGPDERLLALSWSRWDSQPYPEETRKNLELAFDRLVRTLSRKGDA